MTNTNATPSTGPDARTLLKELHDRFPVFREFKPLAIGIDKQLLTTDSGLNRRLLRQALSMHTKSFRYLKAIEKGGQRVNLDGSSGDDVPAEHQRHAAEVLRERAKKEAERRRQQREVEAAEKKHAEKLGQLLQKFAK